MKELTTTTNEKMSSRDIAELTEKKHNKVIRDIKSLIEQEAISLSSFGQSTYKNDRGKDYPMYLLDFEATMTLVTGYDAKRRSQVIARWVELEKKEQQPSTPVAIPTHSEALRLAADTIDKNEKLTKQIALDAPKVELADAITSSSKSITVRDYAKLISNQSGFVIGGTNFYKWLRYEKIVDNRNSPYQRYLNNGWFEIKESAYEHKNTNGPQVCFTTMVTGVGQVAIFERFKKSEYAHKFLNKNARANVNGGYALFDCKATA